MGKLDITYLGINLKNPLIVGASNMVNNIDNIKELEDAGAAAIVYKSLFEEQIQLENLERQQVQDEAMDRHAEMISPFPNMEDAEANEHLFKLKKVKESINIPVFASLNAVYKESWSDYAKQIEDTGVDGLELNFFAVPRDSELSGAEIEQQQIEVLNTVRKSVDIPIAIKLSPFYANPLNLIQKLDKSGAQGFVLFNRMFQPDIDIENEEHITDFHL